jgi:hypothetical protein
MFPNRWGFGTRSDFGGLVNLAPFSGVPQPNWDNAPGYSWPPHLYQEQFQCKGKWEIVSREFFAQARA